MITMTSQNKVQLACGRHADVRFLSFPRAGKGMRDRISHMGKNNGNPDLVCEKRGIIGPDKETLCGKL